MFASQVIPHLTPRCRIGLGKVLTAFGILIAIGVAVVFLALAGANRTTAASPSTPSRAAAGSAPEIRYMGPRQTTAGLSATTSGASGLAAGNLAPRFTCLGDAQRCLR
jgi:hypothetical protein